MRLTSLSQILKKSLQASLQETKSDRSGRLIPDKWEDFAKICDIRSGTEIKSFDPYWYQKKIIELASVHPVTTILKTRQTGITETFSNWMFHKACKYPGYAGALFSKGQTDTSNIAKRIRRQLKSLDEYVYPLTDSLTDLELSDRGRMLFRNSTGSGARGLESIWDLFFDEAAFISDISEIYGAATPSTTMVGDAARIIIVSTPDAQSGWFWDVLTSNNGDRNVLDICDQIRNEEIEPLQYWTDEDGNCKIILHWLAHPLFSANKESYLSDTKKRLGLTEEQLQREYNLSFTSSDVAVFQPALIRKQAIADWEEKPDPQGAYFMGLDSSLLGNDYTVLTILKEVDNRYHLVAQYRDRKKTHEYNLYKIGELIEQYKPIRVGVEVNSAGRIYYDELSQNHLNTDFEEIKTTSASKLPMVNRLILALERDSVRYPNDPKLIEEFLSFRQNGVKLEAAEGKNDDQIMSLCFAIAASPVGY